MSLVDEAHIWFRQNYEGSIDFDRFEIRNGRFYVIWDMRKESKGIKRISRAKYVWERVHKKQVPDDSFFLHLNGNEQDDRIDNLQLVTRNEAARFYRITRLYRKKIRIKINGIVYKLCCICKKYIPYDNYYSSGNNRKHPYCPECSNKYGYLYKKQTNYTKRWYEKNKYKIREYQKKWRDKKSKGLICSVG